MMRRFLQVPGLVAAGLALLLFASPIPAHAQWGYDDDLEYGYYDDGLYDDDWYYDYYDFGLYDDEGLYDDDEGLYGGDEIFEEPGEYEEGTLYDDPGDEGLFDW